MDNNNSTLEYNPIPYKHFVVFIPVKTPVKKCYLVEIYIILN